MMLSPGQFYANCVKIGEMTIPDCHILGVRLRFAF